MQLNAPVSLRLPGIKIAVNKWIKLKVAISAALPLEAARPASRSGLESRVCNALAYRY